MQYWQEKNQPLLVMICTYFLVISFLFVFILADISSKNLDSNERNQFFYSVTKICDISKSLIDYLFVIVFNLADVSSKNLDSNERGYALIGKPEDMHTWFFLYDESMREETADTEPMHNLNATYGNHTSAYGNGKGHRVDLSASISVPNLDHSDPVGGMPPVPPPAVGPASGHNYNYFPGNMHHFVAAAASQPQPPVQASQPSQPPPGQSSNSHQQQAQHNFMMYGHAQSVHAAAPPTPPMMDHHHAHHCSVGGSSLNQHHSR